MASGTGVGSRALKENLWPGRWRKRKGIANVQLRMHQRKYAWQKFTGTKLTEWGKKNLN